MKATIELNHPLIEEARTLFTSIGVTEQGTIYLRDLVKLLEQSGIHKNDPRVSPCFEKMNQSQNDGEISFEEFIHLYQKGSSNLIKRAIQGELIIAHFQEFAEEVKEAFSEAKKNRSGKVATYIPQLGRVNPELFSVSVTTIDGQRFSIGDHHQHFCIQSVCKPINYCLALEEHGEAKVHHHVGREPSGIGFNSLALNSKGLPHNPMINAGAIMTSSLIKPHWEMADRFDFILDQWSRLSGGSSVSFNNSVYLSERETADRNFALGHFMKEKGAFPKGTDLLQTLELYFQCCSLEMTSDQLSVVASTLANGGVSPLTGERLLLPDTVKNCLSLMSSCGMYDFSGEFAFTIGIPAKSGVGGGIMAVIPNLMGIAVYSPRLDALGNSVRGLAFFKELIKRFNFHNYDSLVSGFQQKKDPRVNKYQKKLDSIMSLCWAASTGDVEQLQNLMAKGVDPNQSDYDGRTALHLAASEGHLHAVEYLLHHGAQSDAKDRWGNTPLDDAIRGHHEHIVELLNKN